MAIETAPPRDPLALSEEERSVRDTVRDWAQREIAPGAAERDEAARFPTELIPRMAELGLFGLVSYVDPENRRSIAVAERLGARLDPGAPKQDPGDLVYRHRAQPKPQ